MDKFIKTKKEEFYKLVNQEWYGLLHDKLDGGVSGEMSKSNLIISFMWNFFSQSLSDYKKELVEKVENMETDINDIHYVQGFEDALNKVSSLLQKDKETDEVFCCSRCEHLSSNHLHKIGGMGSSECWIEVCSCKELLKDKEDK